MTTRKERAASRRKQKIGKNILFAAGGIVIVIAAVLLLSDKSNTPALSPARVGKPLGDFSPNTRLLNSLGIHDFPTSILVGTDGVVKGIHVGMFTPKTLEAEITPYLP